MYPGSNLNPEDRGREQGEVLRNYHDTGHHFVMLAEQNLYTTQGEIEKEGLDGYGVVVIPGAELDYERVDTGQHLSHVNPSDSHHVTQKKSLAEILQLAGSDDNKPLIVQLHPQFRFPRDKDILDSAGIHALEIVNSWWLQRPGAFEDSRGRYSPFAFDLWDTLLKKGKPVWGVAGCCSVQPPDVNKSWIQVWSADLTVKSLVSAIRAGRFYVSTNVNAPADTDSPDGVKIKSIDSDSTGMRVTIDTDNAVRINAIVDGGSRLFVEEGCTGTFDVPDFATTYVRFECVGPDDTWNESYDWKGEKDLVPLQTLQRAWTQPIRVVR